MYYIWTVDLFSAIIFTIILETKRNTANNNKAATEQLLNHSNNTIPKAYLANPKLFSVSSNVSKLNAATPTLIKPTPSILPGTPHGNIP